MAKFSRKTTKGTLSASIDSDVIIIGAGLAGLYTALKLSPMPVTIIAAKPLGNGASSLWAQGGIAAAIGDGDTSKAHAQDTIKAGAGLVDHGIAKLVTENAADRIYDLLEYGVPFDKDLSGTLELSREAAHSNRRIVKIDGDRAGKGIMAALIAETHKTPSIRIIERAEIHKIKKSDGRISGVYVWPAKSRGFGKGTFLPARAVVMATGGCGHLFAKTTNPRMARGEGLAMAARVGAIIADAEFMQFHPTAIDTETDPAPLATEALRGEGAHLINSDGKRFMQDIHKDAELAPRDIVALAIDREIKAGRGAFLDCATTIRNKVKNNFPTVLEKCREAGIDPLTDPIPIAPAAHFHMGGIVTDANGRTSIDGLWACGEVASTGLHGANRLASNSLLEAIVFGKRIADDITGQQFITGSTKDAKKIKGTPMPTTGDKTKLKTNIGTLRSIMFDKVGVERTKEGLQTAISELAILTKKLSCCDMGKNIALSASFIAIAALKREESRGCHYRSDIPKTSKYPKRSYLTLDDVQNEFLALTPEDLLKEHV